MKPAESFPIRKERPRGRRSRCRDCSTTARSKLKMAEYQMTYRSKLKSKDLDGFRKREREYSLKTKYGLTLEKYEELLEKQFGKCAICRQPPTNGRGKKLNVDHSHKNKIVRGLLCHGCNTGLGAFQESSEILKRATDYLTTAPVSGDTFAIT